MLGHKLRLSRALLSPWAKPKKCPQPDNLNDFWWVRSLWLAIASEQVQTELPFWFFPTKAESLCGPTLNS